MINITQVFSLKSFVYYAILIFPLVYITGSFLPDLIITIISILYIYCLFKKSTNFIYIRIFQISLLFWIFIILSSFWAPNFTKAIIGSISYARFLILPFALAYFIDDEKKIFLNLSRMIVAIIVLLGCDIIFQNYYGKDIFGYPSLFKGSRNSGFFGTELIAGGFIVKLFFISTLFFITKKQNLFLFLYIFFAMFVVFLTGERMSFLYFLLGITCFLFYFKNNKTKITFVVSFLIIIFSIFFLNPKNKERMYDNFYKILKYGVYADNGEYYKTDKNDFYIINSGWGAHWLAAKNIFLDSPIVGKGLRSFRFICHEKKYETISANDKSRCSTHPHNFYLEILADLGIVGFFLFLLIIVIYFQKLFKYANNDHFFLIKLINLLIIFWPIATTGSIFSNNYASMFWYILSISLFNSLKKEVKN